MPKMMLMDDCHLAQDSLNGSQASFNAGMTETTSSSPDSLAMNDRKRRLQSLMQSVTRANQRRGLQNLNEVEKELQERITQVDRELRVQLAISNLVSHPPEIPCQPMDNALEEVVVTRRRLDPFETLTPPASTSKACTYFTDQTEDFLLPDLDLTRVVDESQDRFIEDAFSDDVAWTEMNEHDQQDSSTDSLGLEHVAAVESTDDYDSAQEEYKEPKTHAVERYSDHPVTIHEEEEETRDLDPNHFPFVRVFDYLDCIEIWTFRQVCRQWKSAVSRAYKEREALVFGLGRLFKENRACLFPQMKIKVLEEEELFNHEYIGIIGEQGSNFARFVGGFTPDGFLWFQQMGCNRAAIATETRDDRYEFKLNGSRAIAGSSIQDSIAVVISKPTGYTIQAVVYMVQSFELEKLYKFTLGKTKIQHIHYFNRLLVCGCHDDGDKKIKLCLYSIGDDEATLVWEKSIEAQLERILIYEDLVFCVLPKSGYIWIFSALDGLFVNSFPNPYAECDGNVNLIMTPDRHLLIQTKKMVRIWTLKGELIQSFPVNCSDFGISLMKAQETDRMLLSISGPSLSANTKELLMLDFQSGQVIGASCGRSKIPDGRGFYLLREDPNGVEGLACDYWPAEEYRGALQP